MACKSRQMCIHPEINSGKTHELERLADAYRAYLQVCCDSLIEARILRPSRPLYRETCPESDLSSTLAETCREHAAGIIAGWGARIYNGKVKQHISRLKREGAITAEQAHALYRIGKYGLGAPKGPVTQADIDAYWMILLDPKVGGRTPRVSGKTGIRLNVNTATLSNRDLALTGWWVAVSGLQKGKRIQVPLVANPKLASALDARKGMELRQDSRARWRVQVVEVTEYPEPAVDALAPRVGVDVGLNCLAATSSGLILGTRVKPAFAERYRKVQSLRANRQRQGLKENSPRLDRLEARLTGMLKSECGRASNQLIQAYPGHTFVIEALDLSGTRGQKRFCYRGLHAALARKAPCGVVNAAYTSQQCPSCGYVSRGNRHGTKFHCRGCGRISHADVVGGLNLLRRSEDPEIQLADRPSTVKAILGARYRILRSSAPRGDVALAASSREFTVGVSRETRIALNACRRSS